MPDQPAAHRPLHPPLRGRDAELAALDGHLEAVRRGQGGVVLLEGLAGAGRTRVLDAALAMARRAGVRPAVGAADPSVLGEAGPLAPLLEAVAGGARPLVDPAALREPPASVDRRAWLVRELEEGLRGAARSQPLLVCLDDVQWADGATLAALRALTARLAADPVVWLLAARREARPAGVDALWGRLRGAGATVVALRALDAAALATLGQDVLGCAPAPGVVELLRGVAERPALAVELLRGLAEEDAVRVGPDGHARLRGEALPARFADAVGRCVAELGPDVGELVRLAAALDRPVGLRPLAALLGRPPLALHAALATAVGAGLLRDDDGAVALSCPLLGEAVRAGVPAATVGALRREAADVLLAAGATAAGVAPLLVTSAAPGDGAAVATLRAAAQELAAAAPAPAAAFGLHALTLAGAAWPGRPALVVETATLLWRAGRADDARRIAQEELAGPLDDGAEAALRLALAAASEQHAFADAAHHARAGLDLPGAGPAVRRALLTVLGRTLAAAGEHGEARAAADAALASARADGDRAAGSSALAVLSACDAARGDLHAALTGATAAVNAASGDAGGAPAAVELPGSGAGGSPAAATPSGAGGAGSGAGAAYVPGDAAAWRALLWSATGRVEDALAETDRGVHAARRRGDAPALRRWRMASARVLLDAGRLAEARSAAETVLAAGEGGDAADATAAVVLARVAVRTGDGDGLRDAERAAARMSAHAAPAVRTAGRWLEALLADAHEPPGDALGRLDELFAALDGDAPVLPAPLDPADLPALARIAVGAGDRHRAGLALRTADRLAADPAATPLLAAVARHVRGLVDGDPAAVATAAAMLSGSERPLARAAALEDYGALLAARAHDGARRPLDAALALYEQAGAERDAARVRLRLRGIGVRRRRPAEDGEGWAGLTPAELQVARLVADGATNREVAERLFVSPHTVSTHLRHAFAKLGIRSRVDLARMAATSIVPSTTPIPVRSA